MPMGCPKLNNDRLATRRSILAMAAAIGLMPAATRAAVESNLVVIGKDGWLFPIWDEVRHSEPAVVRRVIDTLNQGVALLNAAKIEVAISLTPSKSRVFRDMLPNDVKWTAESDRRYASALDDLRRPGTLVPDQATLFASLRKQVPADSLFFKADTHWTAVGAEQSAKLMAQEIAQKRPLPPSKQPGSHLAPAVTIRQERNDLAAMLPQAEQSNYPFQSYALRKPAEAAGGALLDDDTADVVVIGNSYMQPVYGYSSVLSEQLGRPVGLFWKVHQMSPYWDMLTYLGSDASKKQRPRLIVWNLEESDLESMSSNPGTWGSTAMAPAAFLSGLQKALGA